MKLHLGDNFSLPLESVTQTFVVLAMRGAGKTHLASVMAEEMLKAGQQVVIVDPTGASWGLRSGFQIVILGGEHADIPVDEHAGETTAQAIVEGRFSAVLDLSLFRKGQLIRFMVAFAETLYRCNREAMHLFVDEADAVAPQARNYGGDENRMLGAMEDIVRRGRKRGIGCTLITQRASVLNKNVLTQASVLVAMRLAHPRDIGAIKEWIDVHGDPAKAGELIASLPSLPIGTAWFWSPGFGDIFRRVAIRQRETFDSSATPKPGEAAKKPRSLAKIDLAALGEKIKLAATHAKENDPKELKRRIQSLEQQLSQRPTAPTEVEKVVKVPVFTDEETSALEGVADSVQALLGVLEVNKGLLEKALYSAANMRMAQAMPSVRPVVKPVKVSQVAPADGAISIGNSGMRRMLIALAQYPDGLTATKLSLLTGISRSGGTWRTYAANLRGAGYIDGTDQLCITAAGQVMLGHFDPLPTGRALIDYWRSRLGNSGKRKIFDVLVDAYPTGRPADSVARDAGIDVGGGTWRTYIAELRGLELVLGRELLVLNRSLFE